MRYARAVIARGVCAGFVLLFSIVPGVARAQYDDGAQDELARLDAQRALGGDLQISGGVVLGAGVAALLGGSIGTINCHEDCVAAHVALGAGATAAAIGLVLVVVGSLVADDANVRRRRLLRERFVLVPLEDGVLIGARGSF